MTATDLRALGWIVIALTVIGLVITELHFFSGALSSAEYVNMQQFLYGGGVLGKITTVILAGWAARHAP